MIPICEYVVDGRAYRVTAHVVYAPTKFPLGSTMTVRYLGADPGTARVTQGSNLLAPLIALYVTSLVFGCLGGGLAYAVYFH